MELQGATYGLLAIENSRGLSGYPPTRSSSPSTRDCNHGSNLFNSHALQACALLQTGEKTAQSTPGLATARLSTLPQSKEATLSSKGNMQ